MIAAVIKLIFTVYTFMLLARILGSWFASFSQSQIMRFLAYYTDPYLNIFRKVIPPLGVMDLSPMIAFFVLQILEFLLIALIT